MKEKPLPFRQIEWWVMTVLFITIILANIFQSNFYHLEPDWSELTRYFAKILIPVILFLSFFLHHQILIPSKETRKRKSTYYIYSFLILLMSFLLIGGFSMMGDLTQTFAAPYYFSTVGLYIGYLLLCDVIEQIFPSAETKDFQPYNIVRIITVFAFAMLFLFGLQDIIQHWIPLSYTIAIPVMLGIVLYNYFFIYRNRKKERNKLANSLFVLLILALGFFFFILASENHNVGILVIGLAVVIFVVGLLIPFSNLMFKKYDHLLGQINTLSYKVDQGSANLSFLRSQINPHFLFNALNTLYGTALQENAERTSEGIQKLGDMMRFMLHENNQDKIPLAKEKEYLINYVDLQVLRIKSHSNVEIDFRHNHENCTGDIAPMLLIPFVENAFKHGISFQKKSWVKISLRCTDGTIHLDVNNSIHRSHEDDPESKSNGIGLDNVKQRLQLLYPGKHELVIRENEVEYFVHLTIQRS
ncbi:histidine kinase [Aquiflexum sp. TKW24L]|uniref:sensor histidine kinase n=1 Tax=Aquiflexum sp. TKW24L TaxID=2942212 RepID=UPI0020BD80AD|nr:histidine kinase [Aquiflexum sp. TKW24L]MCL6258199.1 histidine kinase [Aquiflexum sp. TKW24L]